MPELQGISKRRKRLGLSQSQLSRLVGVSQSMIAKVEAHSINPSYENARRMFDVLEELERRIDIKAKEISTRKVVGVHPEDNVMKAAEIMRQRGFSQLPVIEEGRPIGSVSEKSILSQIVKGKSMIDISSKRVMDVMEEAFPLVDEESNFTMISSLLRFSPAVLLMKGGTLSGIITKADLLKVLSHKRL